MADSSQLWQAVSPDVVVTSSPGKMGRANCTQVTLTRPGQTFSLALGTFAQCYSREKSLVMSDPRFARYTYSIVQKAHTSRTTLHT